MTDQHPYRLRSLRAILAYLELRPLDTAVGAMVASWCRREGIETVDASTLVAAAHQQVLARAVPALSDTFSGLELPKRAPAIVATLLPTAIWIESDLFGGRHVVLQHEGCPAFTYASFHYDWRYTSNSGTWDAAHALARTLGAQDPIESRQRALPPESLPTDAELRVLFPKASD